VGSPVRSRSERCRHLALPSLGAAWHLRFRMTVVVAPAGASPKRDPAAWNSLFATAAAAAVSAVHWTVLPRRSCWPGAAGPSKGLMATATAAGVLAALMDLLHLSVAPAASVAEFVDARHWGRRPAEIRASGTAPH
jgi:hypothetical protein